jgi:hypothetical protein
MRSFSTLLFVFLALFSLALAANEPQYETTIYLTNTVTQVYTITKSGAHPTGIAVANSTSTIPATYGTGAPYPSSSLVNATSAATRTSAPSAVFTGAAAKWSTNTVVAIVAAGMGLFAF